LFASYQVKASAASLDDATLKKIRDITSQRCLADLKEFDVAYYGQHPVTPLPGAAPNAAASPLDILTLFGPIGTLIDTILGIITPVAVDASTIIDEAKRQQAIINFLNDTNNQNALRDAGTALARAVSDYTFAKRLTLAGTYSEGLAVVNGTKIDLTKLEECSGDNASHIFDQPTNLAVNPAFMTCYHAAWAKYQDGVSSTLKAASEYDTLGDAGDTSTALASYEKITTPANFKAIVQQSSFANPDVFWQYVTQLVGFAGAVQTATSQANKTKIQQEIDAMVKGL
jgi:hypothetical protein